MGSVTDEIVKRASCPVLTVRADDPYVEWPDTVACDDAVSAQSV
jgi:hypothetical protein